MLKAYVKLFKKDIGYFLIYIFLIFAFIALENFSPFLWGNLIEQVKDQKLDSFLQTVIYITGVMFLASLLQNLGFHFAGKSAVRLTSMAKRQTIESLYNQSYEYHTSKKTGRLNVMLGKLANMVYGIYFDIFWRTFSAFIGIVTITIYMFITSPKYGVSTFIVVTLGLIPLIWALKINITARNNADNKDAEYSARVSDGLIAFDTVKSFGKEKYELSLLDKILSLVIKNEDRYQLTFRGIDLLQGIVSSLIIFVNSYLLYTDFKAGNLELSKFVIIMSFSLTFGSKLDMFIYALRDVLKNSYYYKEVADLLNLKPSKYFPSTTIPLPSELSEIVFSNVNFSYLGNDKALSNISLTIPKYSKIALAGESGAGKSTLVKLLLRYYIPQSGNINISGIDLMNISEEELRKAIGIVPQDPVMFNDTILFNVSYGIEDENTSEEDKLKLVRNACEKAKISDFIETLPNKYNTIIGERGIKLSGGQRQRLAIARLFVRNPQIIIFDEATSMLDSESERAIHTALNELTKDKTTIIIAHRLSTIVHCDQIYVMENGKIIEEGNHKSLLEKNGRYSTLWKIQSEGFFVN